MVALAVAALSRTGEPFTDRWQPYVYFRQLPFSGQTDPCRLADGPSGVLAAAGHRRDERRPFALRLKILMLGGSSLWGFGARDDRRFRRLSRGLHERGIRPRSGTWRRSAM